jgi:NADPH:quinone reductase-like Zn-dependent oxidoreductase
MLDVRNREGGKMRAIICGKYGPPEVLELKNVPAPTPKHDELLVRVHATTVTSSDCYIRGFTASPLLWLPMGLVLGFTRPRKPILGMVFSGHVAGVGKNVTRFTVGEKVFGFDRFAFGTYAEYKCIAEKGVIERLPTTLNYHEAAAIPYGGLLAWSYLKAASIETRQRVLVRGASGAVGSAAVQLAKYFGAEVTGICSAANSSLVRTLGADAVLDYTQAGYLNGAETYDLIFDAVPIAADRHGTFRRACMPRLAKNGMYISVAKGTPRFTAADLSFLKTVVEQGKFKPVIDRYYSLEQVAAAHAYVETWHKRGNIIVTVGSA